MAKVITSYECTECGTQSPVQMGRCPRCGSWGTMTAKIAPDRSSGSGPGVGGALRKAQVTALHQVEENELTRRSSGEKEVDRVLGGGWVAGSVLLLAGEPGIGKSTLLLQLAHHAATTQHRTLYVAGEESMAQVKLRAQRLGLSPNMELTRDTDSRVLAEHLRIETPNLVIVDSIQTLVVEKGAAPGSVVQLRDSTALLTQAAKEVGCTLVLIGHVTKQGSIAGPKVIEHMVDATLSLETASGFRILRAIKNRHGPVGEVGVFEMTQRGMVALENPSEVFLAERPAGVPGSVVVAALEGQRPLLLEVQALASKSPYVSPRRVVQGLDQRRVDVVLAVLERRLELPLADLDVYVNVAGGLRLTDPGTDLAVAVAVYSAVTNKPVPDHTAAVGEIGLAGELRTASQLERRAQEAFRSGFKRVIGPKNSTITGASSLSEALRLVWEER
ncbi:MAG: DNA repair protein RadA [Trueperaceae bacterium]|nr:MAG: DNA repair protein RadA [Trueperaceae bacterium]